MKTLITVTSELNEFQLVVNCALDKLAAKQYLLEHNIDGDVVCVDQYN